MQSEETIKVAGIRQRQLDLLDLVHLETNGIVVFHLHPVELVDGTMILLRLVEETMELLIGEEKNHQELLEHFQLEEELEVRKVQFSTN